MKKTYKIEVDCANCANKMEQATKKTPGVANAVVNFMTQKMTVELVEGADVAATMQAVAKALVNGVWGHSPCVLVTETEKEIYVDNPVIVAQCQHLQNTLDTLTAEYKAERAAFREEAQRKIDFLREQIVFKERQMDAKDKQIELLHSLLSRKDQ